MPLDRYSELCFAGVLNLNKQVKQADTVMGTILSLNDNEFDALYMMAVKEGEYYTFETLYESVWGKDDGPCRRDEARKALDNISAQVQMAGEEFMWIEHDPEKGYAFHTRWGHNWQTHSLPLNVTAFPIPDTTSQRKRKTPFRWVAISAVAAAIVLVFTAIFPSPGIYIFEDGPVPLSEAPDSDAENYYIDDYSSQDPEEHHEDNDEYQEDPEPSIWRKAINRIIYALRMLRMTREKGGSIENNLQIQESAVHDKRTG
jgi:hypothetical protein